MNPHTEKDFKRLKRQANTYCKSCGKKWTDHLGIEGTCEKLERARLAIKNLQGWLMDECRYGHAGFCEQVLKETKP